MYSILSDLTLTTVNSVNSAPALQKNFYLTCPQCNSFCMMDTSYFYHASITLTCDCGYNKKLFLSDYLLQMRNNHKPLHNLCKKHRYQSYISFCLNCRNHLCKTCIESGVHQSHSIKSLTLNKKYLLKTDLSTIANTVEYFRVNLDNILIKIGNTKTNRNLVQRFYANLLDIQSYLTQLYYCYETIPNYYIQQTVHYKETKHIKNDATFMLSEESNLRMNNVLMYLFFVFSLLNGIGNSFIFLMIWALANDAVDDYFVRTKSHDEGTAYSIFIFMRKLGQTLAAIIVNISLISLGYGKNGELNFLPTEAQATSMYYQSIIIPAVLSLAMFILLWFIYPLNKKRVIELQEQKKLIYESEIVSSQEEKSDVDKGESDE